MDVVVSQCALQCCDSIFKYLLPLRVITLYIHAHDCKGALHGLGQLHKDMSKTTFHALLRLLRNNRTFAAASLAAVLLVVMVGHHGIPGISSASLMATSVCKFYTFSLHSYAFESRQPPQRASNKPGNQGPPSTSRHSPKEVRGWNQSTRGLSATASPCIHTSFTQILAGVFGTHLAIPSQVLAG